MANILTDFKHPVLIFLFSGIVLSYIIRSCLSIAILEMVDYNTEILKRCDNNLFGLIHHAERVGEKYEWSKGEIGQVLSAFFYGYFMSQVLGGYLSHLFGPKCVLVFSLLFVCLSTILIPILSFYGAWTVVILRIITGISQGIYLPAQQYLITNWFDKSQRSGINSYAMSGIPIGIIISSLASGYLCKYGFAGGWPSVFYIFGGLAIIWTILAIIFLHDKPKSLVPLNEKGEMRKEDTFKSFKRLSEDFRRTNPSLKAIFTSVPFHTLTFTLTAFSWSTYNILVYMPTFFKDILKIDITSNGVYTAIPNLCGFASSLLAGFYANHAIHIQNKDIFEVRCALTTTSYAGMALFLMFSTLFGENKVATVVMMCAQNAFAGVANAGVLSNAMDIAPSCSGIIFGIANTLTAITGLISPLVTTKILSYSSDLSHWRLIFFISSIYLLVGSVVFALYGSAKEEPWSQLSNADLDSPFLRKKGGARGRKEEERLLRSSSIFYEAIKP